MTRAPRHATREANEGVANLDAWKLADDLAVEVFEVTRRLPQDLRWLTSQILRAATSVPANMSEGYARRSQKQFLHFLSIARGSLAEVEYFLHFMHRTSLLSDQEYRSIDDLRRRAAQTLFGLIRSTRLQTQEPSGSNRIREESEDYWPND